MPPSLTLRVAGPLDAPAIAVLIERSVHGLQADDYSAAQRRAALGRVFLVDHGLIADGTYFVVQCDNDGRLAGAGGWSNRKALHGGHVLRDTGERIDPAKDAARIRAYFVDPDFARQGVGSAILKACEDAARFAGFSWTVLGATLTGVPFYQAYGYVEVEREEAPLSEGLSLTVVRMTRRIA